MLLSYRAAYPNFLSERVVQAYRRRIEDVRASLKVEGLYVSEVSRTEGLRRGYAPAHSKSVLDSHYSNHHAQSCPSYDKRTRCNPTHTHDVFGPTDKLKFDRARAMAKDKAPPMVDDAEVMQRQVDESVQRKRRNKKSSTPAKSAI